MDALTMCCVLCAVLSHFSCVLLSAAPWTVDRWASLSMGLFSWSGLSCPPPGDLPDLGVEPASLCLLHWQADSLPLAPSGRPCSCHDLGSNTCQTYSSISINPHL